MGIEHTRPAKYWRKRAEWCKSKAGDCEDVRTRETLRKVAQNYDRLARRAELPRTQSSSHWSEPEVARLKSLAGTMPPRDLATHFDRSLQAIRNKAVSLRISLRYPPRPRPAWAMPYHQNRALQARMQPAEASHAERRRRGFPLISDQG